MLKKEKKFVLKTKDKKKRKKNNEKKFLSFK